MKGNVAGRLVDSLAYAGCLPDAAHVKLRMAPAGLRQAQPVAYTLAGNCYVFHPGDNHPYPFIIDLFVQQSVPGGIQYILRFNSISTVRQKGSSDEMH